MSTKWTLHYNITTFYYIQLFIYERPPKATVRRESSALLRGHLCVLYCIYLLSTYTLLGTYPFRKFELARKQDIYIWISVYTGYIVIFSCKVEKYGMAAACCTGFVYTLMASGCYPYPGT